MVLPRWCRVGTRNVKGRRYQNTYIMERAEIMKIATYNIWNDESTLELRAKRIVEEIRAVDADIIGLQEVSTEFYNKHLATETGYVHHAFMQYPGEEEGLAVLSRYPLIFRQISRIY